MTDAELVANYGCEIDELGHAWGMGWKESDKPHPGFGTYGAYTDQCYKCGMYGHEKNAEPCGKQLRVVFDANDEFGE